MLNPGRHQSLNSYSPPLFTQLIGDKRQGEIIVKSKSGQGCNKGLAYRNWGVGGWGWMAGWLEWWWWWWGNCPLRDGGSLLYHDPDCELTGHLAHACECWVSVGRKWV